MILAFTGKVGAYPSGAPYGTLLDIKKTVTNLELLRLRS
jgi:hypothetical protein